MIKRKKCVIADDVAASRMMLCKWMQELNFDCTLVTDGRAAEEAVRDGDVDLVITDIEMPRMTGLQLLHSVRQDTSVELAGLPVIVVSAIEDTHVEEVVNRLGGTEFVGKPLNRSVLRKAVQRIEEGFKSSQGIGIRRIHAAGESEMSSELRRLEDEAGSTDSWRPNQ